MESGDGTAVGIVEREGGGDVSPPTLRESKDV